MEVEDALLQFCKIIPKIELHAHLNGCVRIATLRELAIARGLHQVPSIANVLTSKSAPPPENGAIENVGLHPYFKFFGLIHQLTTTLDVVRRITKEAIEDFVFDNVKYLELRTTPKHRPEHGITKDNYMRAVLDGINDYNDSCRCVCGVLPNRDIDVRLLLSIDRRETTEEALETAKLALDLAKNHPFGWRVVGLDLGGDPGLGKWRNWQPAMDAARAGGLKITLHCAELWHEEESAAMIAWRPDRLGHMVCMGENLRQLLLESKIPVEICLSSNVKTRSVESFEDHHFEDLYKAGHPVVICTDDPSEGIFNTKVSQEFAIAATIFNLTNQQLLELVFGAVDAAFLSDSEKKALKERMQRHLADIQQHT